MYFLSTKHTLSPLRVNPFLWCWIKTIPISISPANQYTSLNDHIKEKFWPLVKGSRVAPTNYVKKLRLAGWFITPTPHVNNDQAIKKLVLGSFKVIIILGTSCRIEVNSTLRILRICLAKVAVSSSHNSLLTAQSFKRSIGKMSFSKK